MIKIQIMTSWETYKGGVAMYFSRVEVDENNPEKIAGLTHLGAYHNWVEQSFPTEIAVGERKRHLWRIDRISGKSYLLLLSETKPDTTQLESHGVSGSVQVKSYDGLLNTIENGKNYWFRLTANPVKSTWAGASYRGQIRACTTDSEQRAWLIKRSEKMGFVIAEGKDSCPYQDGRSFYTVGKDTPILYHKNNRPVRLNRVSFEGSLVVIDAERFVKTLVTGIGKEKAYGMGLLTVIPEG